MDRSPSTEPATARVVNEKLRTGPVPLWVHPEWEERFPWLVQGTTGRGRKDDAFDLGVYGLVPSGKLMGRWRDLLTATEMTTALHSRQVHGSEVARWFEPLPPGLIHTDGFDAHLTDRTGLLLTVSVADCVPVFLAAEKPRAISIVHAGWRGVAAGIVERAIPELASRADQRSDALWLHCGPSICGACYEVGPEVHEAVNVGVEPPLSPMPIDLRAAIATRAIAAGLSPERITLSGHCTRCGPGDFFSHRAGSSGRQMGVVGCLPEAPTGLARA